jgi:hypothetical protein
MPSCWARSTPLVYALFSTISPSTMRSMSQPSSTIGVPVGASPWKWPGPLKVASMRQRTPAF